MIDHEIRKAVYLLNKEGMSIRKISGNLNISRKTVKKIINLKGETPITERSDKINIDDELITDLFRKCSGYKQRIHEMLEDQGIKIGYSTLTQHIRKLGLGKEANQRCGRVDDVPGQEMQHDTSPYQIKINGKLIHVVASVVYYRYSKQRYLKFYRHFNRFMMKCFLYEAFTYFKYVAKDLVIDNTNLAVAAGSGKNAIFHTEMIRFLNQFGCEKFIAHEIKHSNRKAGNERCFFTVVTNFFPGRNFESMADLNTQAFEWATKTIANRAVTEKKIIPNQKFEEEKKYLKKISDHLPAPYLVHDRQTDQYGYAAFKANYYWVPGTSRKPIRLIEYYNKIKIFQNRKALIEYPLPDEQIKNQRFMPDGLEKSDHYPNNQKKPSTAEEAELRNLGNVLCEYLDFALNQKGVSRHLFIRKLTALYRKTTQQIFLKTIIRAHKYKVVKLDAIERILIYQSGADRLDMQLPDIDCEYIDRDSYKDGIHSDIPDLKKYDKFLTDSEEQNE